jgi:hypothetical protein
MTQLLLDLAAEACGGRLVTAQEGGYSELMSPFCGLSVISTLRGVRSEAEDLMAAWTLGRGADQELKPHQRAAVDEVVAALEDAA